MNYSFSSDFFLAARRIGFACSLRGRLVLPRAVLRRLFRSARTRVEISDFDGDLTMQLQLSEHMQRRIFWMGYYSRDVIAVMKRLLEPGMRVFDIGANIGEVTLIASKCVGPRGRVVSFEPMTRLAEKLEWHVSANGFMQTTVVREALGESVANDVAIYESCGQHTDDENQGLGSLYGESRPSQFVHVTTLDRWVEKNPVDRLDLVKIDIEGAELPCLKGAETTLRRFMPAIIVEIQEFSANKAGYCPTDIIELLDGYGYEFWRIEKAGRLTLLNAAGLSDFQNVLCLPKGREAVLE